MLEPVYRPRFRLWVDTPWLFIPRSLCPISLVWDRDGGCLHRACSLHVPNQLKEPQSDKVFVPPLHLPSETLSFFPNPWFFFYFSLFSTFYQFSVSLLRARLWYPGIFSLLFPTGSYKETVASMSNSLNPNKLGCFCIWTTGVTARLAPLCTSGNDFSKKRNQDGSFLTELVIWSPSQN